MNEIIISWQEKELTKTKTIRELQPSKNPGTVRLGREPSNCDIIFDDPSISRVHVEIFYNNQYDKFYLRNLKSNNPPIVDNELVVKPAEVVLNNNSVICLGQTKIKVIYNTNNILTAPTILQPTNSDNGTVLSPPDTSQLQGSITQRRRSMVGANYLVCPNPNCRKLVSIERLNIGCSWCGTSLADAGSIILPYNN
ncbi:MAG: FHA domain-containing protein [Trichodesmium sp. St5_bin2_1]|nr:FHA domain-containing protein [Trichodesmium sp. St5_bin2_1]MDE5112318.1 FHA domain-containing protein [Trichodesmium sp. St7_bin2_1]